METNEQLRQLPPVDALLRDPRVGVLIEAHSRPAVLDAIRAQLEVERARIRDDGREYAAFSPNRFFQALQSRLEAEIRPALRRVINATGTILHTNLGRAPLADEALRAVTEVGGGYSNLEYDLDSGSRGSRYDHIEGLLCRITGAEAALVVNNNAAAVTLAVNTLAKDGEVVTSRGELVEIGGSFRVPEVIERSEADLVEVGTTNKTRVDDFSRAITPNTRILLKVHPSNYKIVGFTESTAREAIVELARERGLVAMEDLGSGSLIDLTRYGLPREPTVQESISGGMDLVTFSGDKLLGGPQAGVIAGRRDLIERMKANPLLRALRIDKLSLAGLDATLRLYLNEDVLRSRLPVLLMLTTDAETLKTRAEKLRDALNALGSVSAVVEAGHSYAGGGALPEEAVPTHLVCVAVAGRSAQAVQDALRHNDPPVVARVSDERVVFDLRTVFEADEQHILAALREIAS